MNDRAVAPSIASATRAGLAYVSDMKPGIRRIRRGEAFVYVAPGDREISDAEELRRIAALAVPPAYEDVWICPNPRGHLQATGRDARGRKQYRYHPAWRKTRDGSKFERMLEFAAALPRLRRRIRADLHLPGFPREKVLAIVVSLLDATRVRIGNAEYARANRSYGITTLRNRHVRFIRSGRLVLKFRGKGGTDHEVPIDDDRLARLVRECHQLPGQHLFQYIDDAGERRPIDSDQVNSYLGDAMGAEFTAKDFRTWSATRQAIVILRRMPLPESGSERAHKACIADVAKQVAAELRNTPAVCRKSYINPVVFDAWRDGTLHRLIPATISSSGTRAERPVLRFLLAQAARDAGRSPHSRVRLAAAAGQVQPPALATRSPRRRDAVAAAAP